MFKKIAIFAGKYVVAPVVAATVGYVVGKKVAEHRQAEGTTEVKDGKVVKKAA